MADGTGEANQALRVAFDRRPKLEFRGARITSDAGLLAYRELDDALGLTATAASTLAEGRRGKNIRHRLLGLLRQAVYGRLAGYEDVNDAEWLATETNLAALADLSGAWIDRVHRRRPPDGIILDMDSSESPTHGEQEGPAWNGHFRRTCYHPLFVFNQFGDLERCALRPGNVHSAEGWREVLEPVIARYRTTMKRRYFRADAGFASPEVYECLEAEGYGYAIRLPANAVLQRRIAHLLKHPVGRPPHEVRRFYASFRYQAQSWSRSRRVVAKVEWHPGELYPRVGFLVTNLCRPPERVVAFYNRRGTAEPWTKEGKHAAKWTRLSCRSMTANAVRLQRHALAHNLTNSLRTLVLPAEVERRSLSTLRETVVKIGAKMIT